MWWAIQAGASKQRGEEILVLTMHVVMMPSVVTVWTTCHVVSTHHRCSSTSSSICHCPCGSFIVLCLLCQKKGSGKEAILLTWTLSIVRCHLAKGDMAPASHVNKERDGGLMLLTLILSIIHPLLVATWPTATWLLFHVWKKRGGGEVYFSPRLYCEQWQQHALSPSGQHGTSVNVPGHRHPLLSFVCRGGNVVLDLRHVGSETACANGLVKWHWAVVGAVERWWWEVVAVTL